MVVTAKERLTRIDEDTLIAEVDIDQMFVAPYGRPVGISQIGRMLKNGFDKRKLGIITLSMRPDGRFAILDGNHRRHLAMHSKLTTMVARVFIDLSYEEEAELFEALNTIKAPSALDRFNARLERREATAVGIKTLLDQHGLFIKHHAGGARKEFAITAVHSLDNLYVERGPLEFTEVIGTIYEAWEGDPHAWVGAMIDGFRQFWSRYRDTVDYERLVDQLKSNTPQRILATAEGPSIMREALPTRVGKQIAVIYNGRARAKRLPEWPARVSNPQSTYTHVLGRNTMAKIQAARAAAKLDQGGRPSSRD